MENYHRRLKNIIFKSSDFMNANIFINCSIMLFSILFNIFSNN